MNTPSIAHRIKSGNIDTLKEVLREAELYLHAQLTSAIAADQRAYTFAGAVTAAAVILIGASYGLAITVPPNFLLVYAALAVCASFFVSAWMAVVSARSIDFEFAGNEPCKWVDDIENGKRIEDSISEQCEHYDGMISKNSIALKKNGDLFNNAVNLALSSAGVGGMAFFYWVSALHS
jgi:hypothetical protein